MHILFNNWKIFLPYHINIFININRLEESGDKLYQQAIRNLYQYEKNPIEVSAWTIIYNSLEDCFDACESVASCVEEIILKNTWFFNRYYNKRLWRNTENSCKYK